MAVSVRIVWLFSIGKRNVFGLGDLRGFGILLFIIY